MKRRKKETVYNDRPCKKQLSEQFSQLSFNDSTMEIDEEDDHFFNYKDSWVLSQRKDQMVELKPVVEMPRQEEYTYLNKTIQDTIRKSFASPRDENSRALIVFNNPVYPPKLAGCLSHKSFFEQEEDESEE